MDQMTPSRDIGRLIEIMAALRHPDTGCPWDFEQSFATIAPYTIEEAYEVADAIARGSLPDLRDEAGDLLLQSVYYAQLAQEIGAFAFGDIVEAVTAKMIRRHPHVFGGTAAANADAVMGAWDKTKAEERRKRGGEGGLLGDIPLALPALARAAKLQRRAAGVGFDWNDPAAVVAKIREELAEVEAEIAAADKDRAAGEIGDLLFAVTNLARHLKIDPEAALRGANAKFERRFGHIERSVTDAGGKLAEAGLDEMERLWNEAKALEGARALP
jgi:ATP diphosphatase